MILELKTTPGELIEVASGKKNVITREILPNNERRFVEVNSSEEIIGILDYEAVMLTCNKLGASVTIEIEGAKLWEIEDKAGNLLFYDYKGERHQRIEIDYSLGAIINKTGEIPNV